MEVNMWLLQNIAFIVVALGLLVAYYLVGQAV